MSIKVDKLLEITHFSQEHKHTHTLTQTHIDLSAKNVPNTDLGMQPWHYSAKTQEKKMPHSSAKLYQECFKIKL